MKKIKLLLAAIAAMVGVGAQAQTWTGNAVAEGTFYLYNVGAEKFLNNGDPNSEWGTNAYLQAGFGMDVVLANVGEGLYTIDTNVSNGGDSHYMNNSTWTDGAATQWQFRAVEGETNTYQIIYDGQYLMATEALNDVAMVADPGSRVTSTYWKLVSEQDFKDAMVAKTYSATDPMDVSVFIKGRSFARNDGRNNTWVRTYPNANNQKWIEGSNNKYYGNEFWNQTFDIHQEITGLPDGTYEVQCSGFGTNGTTFIYGNNKEGALTTENSAAGGNRTTAYRLIADENAWAGQTTGTFTLSGGNLTVGLKRTTNKSADWCVYDEFRLYYYGLDLSEFAATLADAVAAAEAVNGTIPTAAYNALAAVVTENNKTYTSAADYTAAANAIVEATNTAKAMQANFSRYNTVKSAALTISENVATSEADAQLNAATTNEAIETAIATLRAAFLAELPNVAIPQDPGYIDVTSVMVDNASVSQNTNYWKIANLSSSGGSAGVCNYGECEFYDRNFKFYQTLALTSGTWEFGVTGFHRAGNHKTYFYAGDDKILIPGVANTVVNTMAEAKTYFDNGNGNVALKFLMEAAASIEIGIDNQDTETDKWTIFRNFTLKYYGAPDYSTYVTRLNEALDATLSGLEALEGKVPAVITNEAGTLETTYRDAELANKAAYLAAIETVEGKLTTAQSLEAPYTAYKAAATAAETEGVDASILSTQNTAVDEATTVAAVKECLAEVQYARMTLAVADKTNVDLTSFIINPSFEEGNLNGWTNDGDTPFQAQGNKAFGGTVGDYYAERWHVNATLDINQTLTYLPAGLYKVSVNALAEYEGGVLYANAEETSLGATNTYEQLVKVDDRGSLKFGAKGGLSTSTWFCVDNFTLTYVADDFVYTLVEGKLNATVAAAQTTAEETFNGEKSIANYNALLAAIAAAQASKDAYTAAAAALTKANDILNSTNVYTAEARTAYADAIAAAQAAYEENSMTTEAANGFAASVRDLARAFVVGAWTATNDVSVYTNDWSVEGDAEGSSGMTTPFIEDYVADANKLANTEISATLTGLENGLYSVTAFMRAFNIKEGDDAGYDGISLAVNEGTPVDFAEATEYTDGWAKEITAEGLVKDGNLVIKVAVENTNASWLAFKNVNYTKVRDLKTEEMAVVPTAIALYNGKEEVTEPIALNKTENTVTLTPAYTPADASEGYITWSSTDENVATVVDGKVTAVLPGTATITATSTLDNTVSASAIVTVTYPESEIPATKVVNEGATRTVYTLGENLIKNGSFEYPNPVYGWTTGTGSVNEMSTSNFNIPTTGAAVGEQYLQAKESKGGADAKSINTSWPLEDGKTYVFGYKIKADKQCTTDLGYIGTSLSNTKGTENAGKKFDTPAYGTEWQDVTYTFTNTDNYKYLVFNARWLANAQSFDNFYLCEATYTLEGNVDYATAAIPTTNIGTGAFQYSQDAIDAANALVQGEATVADVEAAYEALTTLNAPEEDKLYNVINISDKYAYNGKALTFKAASDADLTTNSTGMSWGEDPGSYYPQGVKFTAVDGVKNGYTMSYTRADDEVIYIATEKGAGYGSQTQRIRPTNDATKALTVVISSTADNSWKLYNTENGNNIGATSDSGVYTNGGGNSDVKIQEAVNNEVTLNILADNQYATLILPFDATLPEGVKAYSVSEAPNNVLTLVEANDAFKANTPYIVFAENGATATLEGLGSAYTDALYSEGWLTGTYEPITAPVGSYVLQKQTKVGFYQVENVQPQVNANRAYLTVPAQAQGVKAFYLGDIETAIKSVFDGIANGDIYDLNGRKVQKLQKGGVYIVNGKKVSVK